VDVLLLFIDGLGLGDPDRDRNPMAVARTRWFRCFRNRSPASDGWAVLPTDAALGVPGLPQSATGQTALLTGLNAPLLVGRHIQGFCTPSLQAMLAAHSLFRIIVRRGGRITCANAFTEATLPRRRFASVTMAAARTAGVRLRDLGDLVSGQALHHDFTNRLLRMQGHAVPPLTPEEAAGRLANLAAAADFTYYEFIQTDMAGHAQDMPRAVALLEELDRFVSALVERLDRTRHLLVIASDHGNVEDLSSSSHTWNPVPTMVWGPGIDLLTRRIQALTDIAPALLAAWQNNRQPSAVSGRQY
jgi:2,3-bisphosphoglycerate-independent phosphoglycerate mutase